MSVVHVSLGDRSYPIVVEQGLLNRAAGEILRLVPANRVAVLTHPHLVEPYALPLLAGFAEAGVPATIIPVQPGERHKNLRTVARLYDRLIEAGLDRKSLLVTLGGGVLGDIGGFVAATYLRGIPFVQVPTTLLAQVDASVGGKTGVDLRQGKNLVGSFHQPRGVMVDTDTLRTLHARELRSGLAEVVKYGIISDEPFFRLLVRAMPRLLRRDPDALATAIVRSCEIKARVVEADETEHGLRAILNFGHTVGHALESLTAYRRYRHGEAISIGMVTACLIGEEVGITPSEVTQETAEALQRAGLPTVFPADVSARDVLEAITRDKKTVAGKTRFVLAKEIGRVEIVSDVPAGAVVAAIDRQLGVDRLS
jgi:3-dehydroquinate synthase